MVALILGITLIVLGIILYQFDVCHEAVLPTFVIIGAFLALMALFLPVSGYEEPIIVSEIVLDAFYTNAEGQNIYVIEEKYGQKLVTYTTTEKNKYNMPEIVSRTETYRAEVVENEQYIGGVLRTYIYNPKKSMWTLGKFGHKKEYLIIVPTGGVRK